MRRNEDCLDTLYEVKQVVEGGNWVTFDSETTSLSGQIIQWAVSGSDGTVLGSGYVKPTEQITEGARAIHQITDSQLADQPTFDQIADSIWELLDGKMVCIYNADFDISRLCSSIAPYQDYRNRQCPWTARVKWLLYEVKHYCVMEAFAVIYGEIHSYFRSYTWQTLGTALAYFDLDVDQAHDAAADARATALLMQKMYELANTVLPPGYHPARDEECAGGCGKTSGPYRFDEDHTWYCGECGLVAGLYHLCAHCERDGKRSIVMDFKNQPHHIPAPSQLCYEHEYAEQMATGRWHVCLCTRLIEASVEEQEFCPACEEKRKKHPYTFRVRRIQGQGQAHQSTKTDEGYTCSVCLQAFTSEPREDRSCPGVPLYIGWKAIPEGLFTMTQLSKEQRMYTDWHQPAAVVKTFFKRKYEYHELYALSACQPIPGHSRRKREEEAVPLDT